MAFLATAGGLGLLVIGADRFVERSEKLAYRMNLPPFFIGLTVLAFGTSAPELLVAVKAVMADATDLAAGNIIGSNIANTLLVLGVAAMFAPLACGDKNVRYNFIVLTIATVLFVAFSLDGHIYRNEAIVLLAGLILFLLAAIKRIPADETASPQNKNTFAPADAGILIASLVALLLGAQITVSGAIALAQIFGVGTAIIGLTVIAIGTSLPELAATIAAGFRKRIDMSFGAVIGSNIFNLLAVGGIASVITAETGLVVADLSLSLAVMSACVLGLAPFVMFNKKLGGGAAIAALLAYAAYIAFISEIYPA